MTQGRGQAIAKVSSACVGICKWVRDVYFTSPGVGGAESAANAADSVQERPNGAELHKTSAAAAGIGLGARAGRVVPGEPTQFERNRGNSHATSRAPIAQGKRLDGKQQTGAAGGSLPRSGMPKKRNVAAANGMQRHAAKQLRDAVGGGNARAWGAGSKARGGQRGVGLVKEPAPRSEVADLEHVRQGPFLCLSVLEVRPSAPCKRLPRGMHAHAHRCARVDTLRRGRWWMSLTPGSGALARRCGYSARGSQCPQGHKACSMECVHQGRWRWGRCLRCLL